MGFLHNVWWRVEIAGLDHVPRQGPAVLVGVHRGFMPFDGTMLLFDMVKRLGRYPRFLAHPTLLKEVFLSDDGDGIDVVPVETSPAFRAGEPRRLFTAMLSTTAPWGEFAVARDGRVLMFRESGHERRRSSFHIVQNWAAEFKQ